MIKTLLGRASRGAAHKVIAQHAARKGWLQPKFGFALLKNARVPISIKMLAIAIGVGSTGLMVAAEVPIESFLAFILPVLGIALDVAADGAETVVCPLLIAVLLLPHLTPKQIISEIDALAIAEQQLISTDNPKLIG